MRHREREGRSLAPRTWSGESHWAFVLPCRRMPSRWSSSSRIERGENGSGRRRPVAQANVAVVSARFQSGQRHYCAHCGFAIERKSGEGRGLPGSRYSLDGGILSSFESELCFFHFKSAVAVPDPCKKSRFEIYAGDYRSVDPRLCKKRFLH